MQMESGRRGFGQGRVASMAWILPGFVVQMAGILLGRPGIAVLGSILQVVGIGIHVGSKGYSTIWGLWGFVPIMGPIIAILQRPYAEIARENVLDDMIIEEDPHIHPFSARQRTHFAGGGALLLVMGPLGLLLVLFCSYLPHIELSDTPEPSASQAVSPEAPAASDAPATEPLSTGANTGGLEVAAEAPQPLPTPKAQRADAAPPEEPTPTEPDFAQKVAAVRPGMTYDEVVALVGDDVTLISGPVAGGDKLVRWQGPDGSSFTAKFTSGKLARMTALRGGAKPELEQIAADVFELAVADEKPAAETEDALEPAEEPSDAEEASEEGVDAENGDLESEPEAAEEVAAPARQRVSRVGREDAKTPAGRAAMKRPKLPRFTRPIERGPHDVYIYNPYSYPVKVGVRSGAKGRDFTLGSYDVETLYVGNGQYTVYYLEADEPEALNMAGAFDVNSPPSAIRIRLR